MLDEVDVADIMLDILAPAQIELGRLWERGEISIAHEHYTTAITQLSLSLLYPRLLLNRTLLGRSLVATSVGSEAHEVGIRMIADLMEQDGLAYDVPRRRPPARRDHRQRRPAPRRGAGRLRHHGRPHPWGA